MTKSTKAVVRVLATILIMGAIELYKKHGTLHKQGRYGR